MTLTNKPIRRTPLIRRLISIVAVFAVFLMVVPMASAANLEGTSAIAVRYGTSGGTLSSVPNRLTSADYTYSTTTRQNTWTTTGLASTYWGVTQIPIGLENVESTVGVYISFFFSGNTSAFSSTGAIQPFTGQYTNDLGNTGTLPSVDIDAFTPSGFTYASQGHSIKAQFVGSAASPIGNITLIGSNAVSTAPWYCSAAGTSHTMYLQVPSFRVVGTETSAELDAMEAVADEIAAQSQMMEAMYGEIIALCNAIYTRLGDLQTALDLTNSYCMQMVNLLRSIDSTTSNIYDLLGTQFALLISTIENESSEIQQAITDAEAKLEAYFDAAGSGAVGTLPEDTEAIEGEADDLISDESEYESDASQQFSDILAEFNGFSGGALDGVALATDLFTRVWNTFGEWKVVYSFPLIMGLILLVIGRMSRFSGTMNSRNNGDKDVGGD